MTATAPAVTGGADRPAAAGGLGRPAPAGDAVGPEPVGDERSFWERVVLGWHAAFLGLVVLCGLQVALDRGPAPQHRLAAELLLVGLAGWYWVAGRPALGREDPRLGIAYLAGLFAATYALAALGQPYLVLLFAAFPQIWGMLPRTRDAVAGNVAFAAGLVVLTAGLAGWSAHGWLTAGVTALVGLGVSALMGLWISGIVAESDRRADLIGELHRTRDELAAVSRESGVLAERGRLAAEIHDTLAQGFTSVLMLLQAAEADLDRDPEQARRQLGLAQQTARDNLAEARTLVAALVPPELDGGLPAALRRLADRFGQELAIESSVDVRGPVRGLPASCEVVLLRAAQEALANVRKHAGATAVTVTLSYRDAAAELTVRDDGRGFAPGAVPATGYGLSGMRGRLHQIGGQLVVHSGPGSGTAVTATVPA